MFGFFSHEVQTIYRTDDEFAALTEAQGVITSEYSDDLQTKQNSSFFDSDPLVRLCGKPELLEINLADSDEFQPIYYYLRFKKLFFHENDQYF